MDETPLRSAPASIRLIHLLPNLLTITAICAGLTAIRFGYEGDHGIAAQLVLVACVLDGLDGRLARMMKHATEIGAELDSLADFVNFGVAPALILHSWALHSLPGLGWMAALAYAICCVLRLARFNVSNRSESTEDCCAVFVGVPSPAGAVLVMLPMAFSFAVPAAPLLPAPLVALYVALIGLLMISRIPTYSFKSIKIERANAKFVLLGMAILVAALLTQLWATLSLLSLAYLAMIVWTNRNLFKPKA